MQPAGKHTEQAMRFAFSSTAIGLALAAAAVTAAHAQTYITPDATTVAAPATETVQTTETVRTIRPLRPHARQVVTTRTITRQIVPTTTLVTRSVPASQPLYDEAVEAPIADSPQPLYDTVAAPVDDGAMVAPAYGAPAYGAMAAPTYRYVYEPDRILVIDPTSGIAVQSIPR
jgi:hypothetical protein